MSLGWGSAHGEVSHPWGSRTCWLGARVVEAICGYCGDVLFKGEIGGKRGILV